MNIYANGFSYAVAEDRDEVILNFTQRLPVIEAEGTVSSTSVETVASLVLNKKTAQALVDSLSKTLTKAVI